MFEGIRKYFENIKYIESVKAEYYSKGQEDAATRFISQQKNMTKKIEELTAQSNLIEQRLRQNADARVNRMEELHNAKCTSCRKNLEDERQRLIKRQNTLAKRMEDFEEVWMSMYQHANTIIDEHDILLRSSGRLVASRNVLVSFKKRVDEIMEAAAPLLSMELLDSSEDKNIDIVSETLRIPNDERLNDGHNQTQIEAEVTSKK
jgi:hypothetical protein